MSTIGSRVRAARQRLGLTMKQLHDLTGLSTGNISDIENDRNTPSVSSLIPLGRALECSLDWLLTGEETVARNNERAAACDGEPLSEDEADLIAMYRLLEGRDKEDIFELARLKYGRVSGEREASVYSTYTGESEPSGTEKSDPGEGGKTASGIA